MKKSNKTSQIFNTVLRFTLGSYLKFKFRMKANCDEIKSLKGPYIILANHTNNWDPFMISVYIKEPIHFVAGEGNYKSPLLKWALLNLVGAIPKTKFMPDAAAIRQIIKVKNSKGIIGIFPEGQSSWHGITGELIYSTAKLIKSLKLPVVTVVLKGSYLSRPRWSVKDRKGRVELSYHLALTPDKIEKMSHDEIFKLISQKLYHDEMQWQKSNKVAFKGADSERLELFLFACPKCSKFEALASEGTEYKCSNCGYSIDYDEYGNINSKSGILYFDSLYKWDKWQLELLHKKVDSLQDNRILFKHDGTTIYEGKKAEGFSSKYSGSLQLYKDKLIFKCNNGQDQYFRLDDMNGVNVNLNNKLEFFYNNAMYRIIFNNKFVSVYMWVSAINYIKKLGVI